MKSFWLVVAMLIFTPAFAQKPVDPLETGRGYTKLFYDGKAVELWQHFSPHMKQVFSTSDVILGIHLQVTGQFGPETEMIDEDVIPLGEMTIYQREVMFQKLTIPMMVQWTFDANGVIAGYYMKPSIPAETHFLDYKDHAALRLPFRGEWLVLSGGRTLAENRHAVSTDQRFAYDLIVIKNGKTFSGDGSRPDQHYSFGRPILAPGDGTVVEAKDGIPDNIINEPFASPPEGNHVIIDHGNSEFSVLAHLKQGSVKVKPGDKVKAGQVIGRCGNSGNSPIPHLHVHLQNTAVLFKGEGLPIQFQNYLANRKFVESGEPSRAQSIRSK